MGQENWIGEGLFGLQAHIYLKNANHELIDTCSRPPCEYLRMKATGFVNWSFYIGECRDSSNEAGIVSSSATAPCTFEVFAWELLCL